jgi:AcrR family transcriptional regulator
MSMVPDRSPRKQPQQRRSREMQARILEASLRVLHDEGALGFTTTRVALEAGISVGSLYQYFPNKHALVAALHERDIAEGAARVQAILRVAGETPRQKLRELVWWFFSTEAQEAATLGAATGDIQVFLRDGMSDSAHAGLIAEAVRSFTTFIDASSTIERTPADRDHAAKFAMVTIESIGKALAAQRPSPETIRAWADDTASMLADHLRFG